MPKTHSEEEREQARLKKNEYQKEYEKKTNRAAHKKYAKENIKRISLEFVKNTDADIIARIEAQENKTGYIKRLIREDIANNPPKTDA